MLTSLVKRIQKLILDKEISSSVLADSIGVNRSRMSHILTGRNNPSLEIVYAILRRYEDLHSDWLLFGKEPMYRETFEGKPEASPVSIEDVSSQESEGSDIDLFNYNQEHVATEASDQTQKTVLGQEDDEKLHATVELGQNTSQNATSIKSIVILFTDGHYETLKPE